MCLGCGKTRSASSFAFFGWELAVSTKDAWVADLEVVEICAGAGGQALGLERTGFEQALAVGRAAVPAARNSAAIAA
jgi:hypothetical protein